MPIYEFQCRNDHVCESLEDMCCESIKCPKMSCPETATRIVSASKGIVRGGSPIYHPNKPRSAAEIKKAYRERDSK